MHQINDQWQLINIVTVIAASETAVYFKYREMIPASITIPTAGNGQAIIECLYY